MEFRKKILFGLIISMSATMVACNKDAANSTVEEQDVSELKAVSKADIPAGFEDAHVCKDVYLPGATDPRGAVITSKKWANGSVISVRMYGGSTKVRNKVMQYANEWSKHANITFQFVTSGNAQLRVTFTNGAGSYSYIGTDALRIAADKETMNFGWFDDNTSDTEFSRTVIHEFGHALGMIHEHQHPLAAIPWDKDKVYAYYAGYPNYWSKSDVDNNLFAKYATTQTQYSNYDKSSIMHYAVSSSLTTNGFSVGNNTVLSATDKSFIAQVYPKN